jgi:hypothetical protein
MFDIVIGNPPYINISKVKNKSLLKNKFNVSGDMDVGTLFYLVAYDYLNRGGMVCYVTSNKWLGSLSGVWFRKFMKMRFKVMKIINTYRVRLFEAHREVCIVLACKERGLEDYDVEVRMLRPRIGYRWAAARQKGYYVPSTQLNEKIWHLEPPEVMSVYYKIQSRGVPLSEWPVKIVSGIKLRRYISKVASSPQEGTDWIGIIKGRDIQKYFHKSPSFWLPKSAIPSISQAGDKPRIIFSKLNAEIGFVLAAPYIYGDETTYILELIDCDEEVLYYLLGILNSNFFSWCFRKFYAGGGIEGEVKLYAFKQFPIPRIEINPTVSDRIIEIVKRIYNYNELAQIKIVEHLVLEMYRADCSTFSAELPASSHDGFLGSP